MCRHGFTFLLLAIVTLTSCSSSREAKDAAIGAEDGISNSLPFSEESTIFEIVPGESEARFLIDEIFHGEETTIMGKTGQVAGQIAFDFDDPSTAAAGPIQVNVRTLQTDNSFRNRAIQNRILLANVYEFVTFTPTAVKGLPENISIGLPLAFQLQGDLTITAYTRPVTFEVTAVPVSPSRLEGSAMTTINRSDFDLVVPSATGVAGVAESVILELEFVATAIE